ncbi:MAG: S-adenosylmethionine decarboxylase, partial [Waddliaceae bacterium]
MTSQFGPHLMLDCRQCNKEKISSMDYVFQILSELPEFIGMTKISQPHVFHYAGRIPEDEGITGVVIIAESHITFHPFTEKDFFFFDLFSCKPFDLDRTITFITYAFEVKTVERHVTLR